MITIGEYLDWDSCFFGYGVARIVADENNEKFINDEISRFRQQGCRLIYVFSRGPLILTGLDAALVDRKRSYKLSSPKYSPVKRPIVPVYDVSDSLYDLGCQAGVYSRYNVDPRIKHEDFRRLYRLWVDNSVSRQFADYLLAYEMNGRYIGFVTAKVKGDMLSVGLIATDSRYRGRGIGTALMQSVINISAERGLAVEVTTQSDNTQACQFYEHLGFSIDSQDYVYHVWLEDH